MLPFRTHSHHKKGVNGRSLIFFISFGYFFYKTNVVTYLFLLQQIYNKLATINGKVKNWLPMEVSRATWFFSKIVRATNVLFPEQIHYNQCDNKKIPKRLQFKLALLTFILEFFKFSRVNCFMRFYHENVLTTFIKHHFANHCDF